ncbi:hypothetical protein [uncultured Tateyamaria sp.]|uniref:hypothetical protein n=1 Tax=uncultured Tateyamaria sp. TaxID=455651 RepID=UPI002631E53F|nr:hypothetical protein [uncultured Tateyamaria sp.]
MCAVRSARTGTPCSGSPIGKRHYRVKLGDVLEAHEQSLEAFGGLPGICNLDSILGAIGRPYHGYDLAIHAGDRIDDVVVDVVTGAMSQSALETWFCARLSKLDD